MAKLRDLQRPALTGETIEFEVRPGVVASIRIVPLLSGADAEIAKYAREYAIARGAKSEPSDPEYNIGLHAKTLALACLDPDDGKPFFASPEEVLGEDGLDRTRIAMLYEHQQRVQENFSPGSRGDLTALELLDLLDKTTEATEGAELPFERLPRAKRRTFVRGIAAMARASLWAKSGPGLSSPESEMSSESTAKPPTSAQEAEP